MIIYTGHKILPPGIEPAQLNIVKVHSIVPEIFNHYSKTVIPTSSLFVPIKIRQPINFIMGSYMKNLNPTMITIIYVATATC